MQGNQERENSTAQKERMQGEASKGWLATIKKERSSYSGDAMNLSEEGLWSYLTSYYEGIVANGDENEESSQFVHTKCPIGVTLEDIKKVIELLELKRNSIKCVKPRSNIWN